MNLSANFTLEEFCRSTRAERGGINNVPPPETVPLAREFCENVMQPIRDRWGRTRITSGYRCPILNTLVSGDPFSQHIWTKCHVASDFQTLDAALQDVFDWIRLESGLPFDTVIFERGQIPDSEIDDCIHISYVQQPRRIAMIGLTHNRAGYTRVAVA